MAICAGVMSSSLANILLRCSWSAEFIWMSTIISQSPSRRYSDTGDGLPVIPDCPIVDHEHPRINRTILVYDVKQESDVYHVGDVDAFNFKIK